MTTTPTVNGLHHVTAIAADAQRNHDFWAKVLGLRFVKKTVNFDDPGTYHLYYGDEVGTPGTVLTFFPWRHLPRGREGTGEASLTAFAIPADGVAFWLDRLAAHGVEHEPPTAYFGEEAIVFYDPDGMKAALVVPRDEPDVPDGPWWAVRDARWSRGPEASDGGPAPSEREASSPATKARDERTPWTTPEIGAEHAVRGFHGVTLALADRAATARLLTEILGYEPAGRDGDFYRYASPHAAHARCIDIIERPNGPRALQGAGRVHHIAFSVEDDAALAAFRERLVAAGLNVTPRIDRTYFHSIYFRSPGGVLFEIATENPGFTVDEARGELGRNLKLPHQHEHLRARLERELPPLAL